MSITILKDQHNQILKDTWRASNRENFNYYHKGDRVICLNVQFICLEDHEPSVFMNDFAAKYWNKVLIWDLI